jgi:hypothetical protein
VAGMPALLFYEHFNLRGTYSFSEFHFKEMIKIFHLPGMTEWSKLNSESSGTKGKNRPQICVSLVCFKPLPLPLHHHNQYTMKGSSLPITRPKKCFFLVLI